MPRLRHDGAAMTASTSTAPPVSAATVWRFVLPIALTSANDHVVNGRDVVARARYKARRNAAAQAIGAVARVAGLPLLDRAPYVDPSGALYRSGKPVSPRPFRSVHIVRMLGARQRQWDDDNLIAACKALRDACQLPRLWRGKWIPGASIVVDDSAKWSAWTYAQERAVDGVAAVRIEVSETTTAGGEPVRSE